MGFVYPLAFAALAVIPVFILFKMRVDLARREGATTLIFWKRVRSKTPLSSSRTRLRSLLSILLQALGLGLAAFAAAYPFVLNDSLVTVHVFIDNSRISRQIVSFDKDKKPITMLDDFKARAASICDNLDAGDTVSLSTYDSDSFVPLIDTSSHAPSMAKKALAELLPCAHDGDPDAAFNRFYNGFKQVSGFNMIIMSPRVLADDVYCAYPSLSGNVGISALEVEKISKNTYRIFASISSWENALPLKLWATLEPSVSDDSVFLPVPFTARPGKDTPVILDGVQLLPNQGPYWFEIFGIDSKGDIPADNMVPIYSLPRHSNEIFVFVPSGVDRSSQPQYLSRALAALPGSKPIFTDSRVDEFIAASGYNPSLAVMYKRPPPDKQYSFPIVVIDPVEPFGPIMFERKIDRPPDVAIHIQSDPLFAETGFEGNVSIRKYLDARIAPVGEATVTKLLEVGATPVIARIQDPDGSWVLYIGMDTEYYADGGDTDWALQSSVAFPIFWANVYESVGAGDNQWIAFGDGATDDKRFSFSFNASEPEGLIKAPSTPDFRPSLSGFDASKALMLMLPSILAAIFLLWAGWAMENSRSATL